MRCRRSLKSVAAHALQWSLLAPALWPRPSSVSPLFSLPCRHQRGPLPRPLSHRATSSELPFRLLRSGWPPAPRLPSKEQAGKGARPSLLLRLDPRGSASSQGSSSGPQAPAVSPSGGAGNSELPRAARSGVASGLRRLAWAGFFPRGERAPGRARARAAVVADGPPAVTPPRSASPPHAALSRLLSGLDAQPSPLGQPAALRAFPEPAKDAGRGGLMRRALPAGRPLAPEQEGARDRGGQSGPTALKGPGSARGER